MSNEIIFEVRTLDKPFGYTLQASANVPEQEPQFINEHYSTEAALKARLGTLFQWWANQVDSEA